MPPKAVGKSPARGSAASAPKKKPATARNYKRPVSLPNGLIVEDKPNKKEWRVGELKGQGGFADVYLVSDHISKPVTEATKFVLKVEPSDNGPLFQETKFFKTAAKKETIGAFIRKNNLKSLGILEYVASGVLEHNDSEVRWLVLPRLGRTVQDILEENNGVFSRHWVILLALQLLDILEYIHSQGYAHADIKASNLMTGFSKADAGQIYLLDFGLVKKFMNEGAHIEYVENPKAANDGTLEFTSVDAHKGAAASRRGDLQILGFNLVKWLVGSLPWSDDGNGDFVKSQKVTYLKNVTEFFRVAFLNGEPPKEIVDYFKRIKDLAYDEAPNYAQLREIFQKASKDLKVRKSGLFTEEKEVPAASNGTAAAKKAVAKKPAASDREDDDKTIKAPAKRVKKAASTNSVISLSGDEDDDKVAPLPSRSKPSVSGVPKGRTASSAPREMSTEALAKLPPGQRRKVKAAMEENGDGVISIRASSEDLSASRLAKLPPGQRFKLKAAVAVKKLEEENESEEEQDAKPGPSRSSEPARRPLRAAAATRKTYKEDVSDEEDKKSTRKLTSKRTKNEEL